MTSKASKLSPPAAPPLHLSKISFYKLYVTPIEKALPRFLEKLHTQQICAVIRTTTPERVEALCQMLWTYNPSSFLPHGSAKDGFPQKQPFWLTCEDDRPPQATALILLDGVQVTEFEGYTRGFYFFDGNIPEELNNAHLYWRTLEKKGLDCQLWQQNAKGQWEEKSLSVNDILGKIS